MEVIMKTLKIALVLAMVSFTMMGMARDLDRPDQNKQIVELKVLLDKPLYVNAILSQVNPAQIMNRDAGDKIIVKIKVHSRIYEVVASYGEWKAFFDTRHILPFFKKNTEQEHKIR
jgi:hypothetical protein